MSVKKIGIIDAVLICNQCGQKIKLKHLKCQKEKREKLISEFLVKISDLYYKDSKLLFMETKQEYEERLK